MRQQQQQQQQKQPHHRKLLTPPRPTAKRTELPEEQQCSHDAEQWGSQEQHQFLNTKLLAKI
jgi:hypothetical protein